jgi:hypothetical protein
VLTLYLEPLVVAIAGIDQVSHGQLIPPQGVVFVGLGESTAFDDAAAVGRCATGGCLTESL